MLSEFCGNGIRCIRPEFALVDVIQSRQFRRATTKGRLDQMECQCMQLRPIAGHLQLIRGIAQKRVPEKIGILGVHGRIVTSP